GRVAGASGTGYSLEYLYLNTLSELAVFGRLPTYSWLKIFARCGEFLSVAASRSEAALVAGTPLITATDYADKTMGRLEPFAAETGFDLDAPTQLGGKPVPSVR